MEPSAALAAAQSVIELYDIDEPVIGPLGRGLINDTFKVTADNGQQFVLQKVNEIFDSEVNADIAQVTAHLSHHGIVTPQLYPLPDNRLWVDDDGAVWRLFNYIEGDTLIGLTRPAQARSAGHLLASFHTALLDYQQPLHNARLGVHDFDRHLRDLHEVMTTHAKHPRFHLINPLARRILSQAEALEPLPELPDRVVHGDPKITNVVFKGDTDEALCFIDLDTLARMPVALELGDAFRSWCGPPGEDTREGCFSLDIFSAAVDGYAGATRIWLETAEWQAIVPATLRIFTELAARFCTDALKESYFGWDPARFANRSEHNEVRAEGQINAAIALAGQYDEASRVVQQAFTS